MRQVMGWVLPVLAIGFVTLLLLMLAFFVASGALARAVGARYLNEEISIGKAYGHVLGMFGKYLGTCLLSGLVIGLGLLCLILPGIFFSIWFVFTATVCVLEGLGGTSALGRSRELARGNAWRIIGMFLLTVVIGWVFGFGAGAINGFILPRVIEDKGTLLVLSQAIEQSVNLLLQPFFSVAWILLYYDIRIRKEAFDLEVLAKSMGAASPVAAPPS